MRSLWRQHFNPSRSNLTTFSFKRIVYKQIECKLDKNSGHISLKIVAWHHTMSSINFKLYMLEHIHIIDGMFMCLPWWQPFNYTQQCNLITKLTLWIILRLHESDIRILMRSLCFKIIVCMFSTRRCNGQSNLK